MVDKEYLREALRVMHAKLPDAHGFILLVVTPEGPAQRVIYGSSLARKDAINVLKEWLISASGEEEWMKHIE
jgi:hypothetical protein